MTIDPLFYFGLPCALAVWLFLTHRAACEHAEPLAKRYCQQRDVQLLDDTVQFQTLKWVRSGYWLRVYRCFSFEYTSDISERGTGWLIMHQHHAQSMGLDEDATLQ